VVPLPADFTLAFAATCRRPRPEVLIGGAPLRVLRLSSAGARLLDGWVEGQPVGPGPGAGLLAARLVDGGLAVPVVPPAGPGGPDPLVGAVVIPVRDDPSGLGTTLAALRSCAPELAVHVVDDGSHRPVETPAGVRLHRRSPSAGPGPSRNLGVRLASAGGSAPDVIVFVDAGCIPHPGCLAALLAQFRDPGVGAAAPRITSRAGPGTRRGLARYETAHSPLDLGPEPAPVRPGGPVPFVPTAVLAVRASALAGVGGFDEGLRFGEDVDLVWRLHRAGWRVRYDPAVTASHPARDTYRAWLRQRFDYGRSASPLAARHGRDVAPLRVSPWSATAWGCAAAGRPLAGAALAAGAAQVLSRRAGADRVVAGDLRRLALGGTARAAVPLADAVRRAWLPPAAAALALTRRYGDRRARFAGAAAAVSVLIGPGWADWAARRPATGPLRWTAWRLADDLAYQAGVWAGVAEARSAAALLPRW